VPAARQQSTPDQKLFCCKQHFCCQVKPVAVAFTSDIPCNTVWISVLGDTRGRSLIVA
jgi:hypothetical protein